jgi:FXSXX-COOH protein
MARRGACLTGRIVQKIARTLQIFREIVARPPGLYIQWTLFDKKYGALVSNGSVRMSQPPADKETILVDVSGLSLDDLLENDESPLIESLRRLATESDTDAIAGFNQGMI